VHVEGKAQETEVRRKEGDSISEKRTGVNRRQTQRSREAAGGENFIYNDLNLAEGGAEQQIALSLSERPPDRSLAEYGASGWLEDRGVRRSALDKTAVVTDE